MPVYFLDSSALVKCYVSETGTAWVRTLVDSASGNELFGLNLTEVEVVSAITRRERTGSLPPGAAPSLIQKLRTDFANEFVSLEVTSAIVTSASALCEKHRLRAYDGVQLAAALQFHQARTGLGLPAPTIISGTHKGDILLFNKVECPLCRPRA